MPIPVFSTATLELAVTDEAKETEDKEQETAAEADDSADDDKVAAVHAIIEGFVELFPSPSKEQIESLMTALLLTGEQREQFTLSLVECLVGAGDDTEEDEDEDDLEIDLEDDEDEDLTEEEKKEQAAILAAFGQDVALNPTPVSDDLTDALNNDGQDIRLQPGVDDTLLQDDGEPDLNALRPASEQPSPLGNDDGESMTAPDQSNV